MIMLPSIELARVNSPKNMVVKDRQVICGKVCENAISLLGIESLC